MKTYHELQRNIYTYSRYAEEWVRDSAGQEHEIISEADYDDHDLDAICAYIRHCLDLNQKD